MTRTRRVVPTYRYRGNNQVGLCGADPEPRGDRGCPEPGSDQPSRRLYLMINPPTPSRINRLLVAALSLLVTAWSSYGLDDEHWSRADTAIERGIAYLTQTQAEDGRWSPRARPAVTALVVGVMLDRPDIGVDDPRIVLALDYILAMARDDGGIHDGILANYNTAICLSALSRVDSRPDVAAVIAKAQDFLRRLQWDGQVGPDGRTVDRDHPFYGGAGYGRNGRPDLSNTQIMLQRLHDSGLDCDDPAFVRAVVFISQCQSMGQNQQIEPDGGFIYATSINDKLVGVPQSMASPQQTAQALAGVGTGGGTGGTEVTVSGLRTYGSMTYAGFKSYIYANLGRDDPRVVAAYQWIGRNYTMVQNPGMPAGSQQQGLYYYYMTAARSLDAWGSSTIQTPDGVQHDWANDLIAELAGRQREDGSWLNEVNRWMEDDANLVTAYALIALQAAIR
jgi:squalene-hopene/tetraprenyl-beta-curcumene cyclase